MSNPTMRTTRLSIVEAANDRESSLRGERVAARHYVDDGLRESEAVSRESVEVRSHIRRTMKLISGGPWALLFHWTLSAV
jgi:hypothetical protein